MAILIDSLVEEGWLKTPQIIAAFKRIKRADFLPDDMRHLAEINEALPVGWGQTISQPLVVAFMLELLQVEKGHKVLDVGSGSGWTTALLAEIAGTKGMVIAIERIPELKSFGENNARKYNLVERGTAEFICGDGSLGYSNIAARPELAEGFDRILASAAAKDIPTAWKEQVKTGGKIVAPVGSSIWLWFKLEDGSFAETEYPGFSFVPLILNHE